VGAADDLEIEFVVSFSMSELMLYAPLKDICEGSRTPSISGVASVRLLAFPFGQADCRRTLRAGSRNWRQRVAFPEPIASRIFFYALFLSRSRTPS